MLQYLESFTNRHYQLTPFVAETVQRTRTTDAGQPEVYPKRFTGEDYLRAWKMAGGHDIIEETSAVESKGTIMPTPFEEKR
jgi:large subunit ribosomal protein L41